ncbi:hypothetical protein [Haloferax volcanii]|uniref:hypothetical protein n=1 Tax=Haloferax volcanii TaxID=2246 RepID=UPI003D303955
MGILNSLPPRPLRRSEVDSLDSSDAILGNFPVYGEVKPDTCYALVLVTGSTAKSIAYTGDGWEVLDEREVSTNPEVKGIPFDQQQIVSEMQEEAAEHVSV